MANKLHDKKKGLLAKQRHPVCLAACSEAVGLASFSALDCSARHFW